MTLHTHHPRHQFIAIAIGVLAALTLCVQWIGTNRYIDETVAAVLEPTPTNIPRFVFESPPPLPEEGVKGVYITAYSAGNKKKMDEIIALIKRTELNAVVIDTKDYSGKVLYATEVPLAQSIGAADNRIGDVKALIDRLHDEEIYVIARQTVFQDPLLAQKKPEWAMKSKAGGVWRDHKGLSWVDPTKKEVWEYNVALAKESVALGFDEINFDYVRFPSDGNMSLVVYSEPDKPRYDTMREFYTFLGESLASEGAYISLDLFGFVMERHDGMSIGQRLEDAVDHVDFISPMMYPSHYPSGHLGLLNPAASPGIVIDNGMKKGVPYFVDKRAAVRPWLQAFNLGATYGAANIRAQIDMVEKYPNAGWLLWNAANRYTDAGLKKDVVEEEKTVSNLR